MRLAYRVPLLSPDQLTATLSLLRLIILGCICGAAVSSRLFAVVRFESIIHELCALSVPLLPFYPTADIDQKRSLVQLVRIDFVASSRNSQLRHGRSRATKVLTEQGFYVSNS